MQDCKKFRGLDDSLVTRKRQAFKANVTLLHSDMSVSGTKTIEIKPFLTLVCSSAYILLLGSTQAREGAWKEALLSLTMSNDIVITSGDLWIWFWRGMMSIRYRHGLTKSGEHPRKSKIT